MQEGGNRGQSLSWERIELCNDGKCQLRGGQLRKSLDTDL